MQQMCGQTVLGSPSDLNTGNRIEGATGCPSWCRPLRPLFHFLCSNLKANPVQILQTQSGEGSKIPKMLWTSYVEAPRDEGGRRGWRWNRTALARPATDDDSTQIGAS